MILSREWKGSDELPGSVENGLAGNLTSKGANAVNKERRYNSGSAGTEKWGMHEILNRTGRTSWVSVGMREKWRTEVLLA